MTRRFWIGLVLTVPVVALEMGGHLFGWHPLRAVAVELGAARARDAGRAVGRLAVLRARLASLVTPQPQHVHADRARHRRGVGLQRRRDARAAACFRRRSAIAHGAVAVYFEAAAVITVLVLLGQVLELRAREQTSGAIRALLDLAPKTAHQRRPSTATTSGAARRSRGRRSAARAARREGAGRRRVDRGPFHARRVDGDRRVDAGRARTSGAKVIGGTINRSGGFVMRAEKVGRDTMLAQIVQMVAAAQRSRAPIQRLADQVAGWFVPAVIAVAVLAFAAWATFGPEPRFAYGLVAAVTVLIIACPCALGLATPMSIMVGVGRGAQAGVLIKNAEALERMEKVDTLVIDKTGTLTEGRPKVVAIKAAEGFDETRAAAARRQRRAASEHPLARAIVEAAAERKIELAPVRGFDSPTGKGAIGMVERRRVVLGNARFLGELGIATDALEAGGRAAARRRRDRDLRRHRRQARGRHRHRRSGQGQRRRGARGAQGRRHRASSC